MNNILGRCIEIDADITILRHEQIGADICIYSFLFKIIFTGDQFWPMYIVFACVGLCVRMSGHPSLCQQVCLPNNSPVQTRYLLSFWDKLDWAKIWWANSPRALKAWLILVTPHWIPSHCFLTSDWSSNFHVFTDRLLIRLSSCLLGELSMGFPRLHQILVTLCWITPMNVHPLMPCRVGVSLLILRQSSVALLKTFVPDMSISNVFACMPIPNNHLAIKGNTIVIFELGNQCMHWALDTESFIVMMNLYHHWD